MGGWFGVFGGFSLALCMFVCTVPERKQWSCTPFASNNPAIGLCPKLEDMEGHGRYRRDGHGRHGRQTWETDMETWKTWGVAWERDIEVMGGEVMKVGH